MCSSDLKSKKWKEPHKLRVASTGKLRHCFRTMKGKGLIIFAGFAIFLGAGTAIKLSQTIKDKEAEITGLESDKASLEKDKESLKKDKKDLTEKLDTADKIGRAHV